MSKNIGMLKNLMRGKGFLCQTILFLCKELNYKSLTVDNTFPLVVSAAELGLVIAKNITEKPVS